MFRDFLTVPIVCLSLFGTVAQQEGDSLGLKLLAATGDSRRSMIRFVDLYAGLKAGVAQTEAALRPTGGWSDVAVES